ncbi:hypothetical protein DFS34DRAFT_578740, partial [Phlyctochytrium arcticum]
PGLNNLGNTCFFNSVMQCIAYTQPLFDRLKTADEENQLVKGPFTGALYGFLNQMKATGETGGTVNPRDLFSCLSNTWRIYRMYGQQDSHELLRRLLDGVREEQLKKDENDKTIPNQRTLVENCFGGELVQAIVCDRCKHVSYSLEEYMDLSLPIAAEAKARGGLLATTTVAAPITIVEPRQRICNRAFKRYLLHSVPDVLVVQLKRFQSSGFAGRTKKCDDPVIFQEFLDLQPFMAPAAALGHRESGRYRLNGVVVHGGGLFSGHYTAYVRILQNATLAKQQSALGDDDNDAVIEWAYCSDTNVRASTIEEVLCSQAYLLLYERMAESVGR